MDKLDEKLQHVQQFVEGRNPNEWEMDNAEFDYKRNVYENRYCHFAAFRKTGIITDIAEIRGKSIVLLGCSAIGGLALDMIARSGVGRIVICDGGVVDSECLSGMFYMPQHVGMSKIQAARIILQEINPNVRVEGCFVDFDNDLDIQKLAVTLAEECRENKSIDLMLCTLYDVKYRIAASELALEMFLPMMCVVVAKCTKKMLFACILPGHTACVQCMPGIEVDMEDDRELLAMMPASFPSIELMAAGIVAQNAFKFLLNFGKIAPCMEYNADTGCMLKMDASPSPECKSRMCQYRTEMKAECEKDNKNGLA